ncbi:MAG: PfkB family carbohydrate kinase [Planctomycetota bacterium]
MTLAQQRPGPIIVGIGEALFDRIAGKGDHLGGAPLNFAVHAKQMLAGESLAGGRSVLVSRVGRDALGDRLLAALRAFGVETDAIQTDLDRATGIVDVSIGESGPSYLFREDPAWDNVVFTDRLEELSYAFDAVCFGTLARRRPATASAIERFVRNGTDRDTVRLYDVNLRPGATEYEVVRRGLELASIAKMNDEELPVIAEMFGASAKDEIGQAATIIRAFGLQQLMLTRGARGVIVYTPDSVYEGEASKATISASSDAVGAGDSCGAAYAVRLLSGDSPFTAATVANKVGAYVASHSGATPSLPAHLTRERPSVDLVTARRRVVDI